MAGEQLNQEAVLKTLGKVLDPELGKDLVTLGMIENVEVKDSVVSFNLKLTTPACPLKDEIRSSALAAGQALDGVKDVQIKMDAKVPVGQKKSE